jgi:hypothetical protein
MAHPARGGAPATAGMALLLALLLASSCAQARLVVQQPAA